MLGSLCMACRSAGTPCTTAEIVRMRRQKVRALGFRPHAASSMPLIVGGLRARHARAVQAKGKATAREVQHEEEENNVEGPVVAVALTALALAGGSYVATHGAVFKETLFLAGSHNQSRWEVKHSPVMSANQIVKNIELFLN